MKCAFLNGHLKRMEQLVQPTLSFQRMKERAIMKRHSTLNKLTAILLALILMLPIFPIFAEENQPIDQEAILFNYDIEYTVPSDLLIKYFDTIVVPLNAVGKMQLKPSFLVPNPPWTGLMEGLYLEWSAVDPAQLTSTGTTFNGTQLIIPPTAKAGTVVLKATIYMAMPMGMPAIERYSEQFTFNITQRIPQIRFINPPEDFLLAVPYYENTLDKDYRVEVVDQYGVVIPGLTPVLKMAGVSNAHMNDYYNPTTNHLHLYGEPGYAGEIHLHAYIEEFGDSSLTSTGMPLITEPILSVDKTIVISREEDYPYYGILSGKARIAVPESNFVEEVYNYKLYSQYNVALKDVGDFADFYFPSNQPATFTVDTDEQSVTVKVASTAPHSYLMIRANLTSIQPTDTDEEVPPPKPTTKDLWFGWETSETMYIYLDKTVYGQFDDHNNVFVLAPDQFEEDAEDNLQFRIKAYYPDEVALESTAKFNYMDWLEGWRDYNPENPQTFPGKMDVEFRYKNNYRWMPDQPVPVELDLECKPKDYGPGEVKLLNFTVLKPFIGINPASPFVGNSATVTLTYDELHPGFELVPADVESDLYWYDPDEVPYIALKSMWYKLGEAGTWTRYSSPFSVTSNTTIFAKTVVFLELVGEMIQPRSNDSEEPMWNDYSGDYTSPITSLAVAFQQPQTVTQTNPPETQAPTQPETQAATTQPVTQAETQPTTLAPVETTTVAPEPVTVALEEVTVPQGALEVSTEVDPEVDLVFNEVITPLGDATLPETNELPITLLYGIGILVGGLGVYFVKRKDQD